jgi:hypothetical protein
MASISTYFSSGGGGGGSCPTCVYTSSCLWTPHADGTVIFHVIGGGSCGWSSGDRTAAGGAGGYSNKCIEVTTSDCYCIIVGGMCGDSIACNVVGTTMCILGGGRSGPDCSCGALGSGGDVNYQGGCGMCYFTGGTRCFSAQGGSVGIYAAGRNGLCSNQEIVLYPDIAFAPLLRSGAQPYLTKLPWNVPNIPTAVACDSARMYKAVGIPIKNQYRQGCCAGILGDRVCMGWFVGGNPICGSCACGRSECFSCFIHAGCGGGGGAYASTNGCGGAGIAFIEYISVG